MSETMQFPPATAETAAPAKRTHTVYFIDDSATMREVIKIAFRRENITVITARDAATPVPTVPVASVSTPAEAAWPRALADSFTPHPHSSPQVPAVQHRPAAQAQPHNFNLATPNRPQASGSDIQKLKPEISRLELLIKKLQTELQIERQYNQALELHVKSLTAID